MWVSFPQSDPHGIPQPYQSKTVRVGSVGTHIKKHEKQGGYPQPTRAERTKHMDDQTSQPTTRDFVLMSLEHLTANEERATVRMILERVRSEQERAGVPDHFRTSSPSTILHHLRKLVEQGKAKKIMNHYFPMEA